MIILNPTHLEKKVKFLIFSPFCWDFIDVYAALPFLFVSGFLCRLSLRPCCRSTAHLRHWHYVICISILFAKSSVLSLLLPTFFTLSEKYYLYIIFSFFLLRKYQTKEGSNGCKITWKSLYGVWVSSWQNLGFLCIYLASSFRGGLDIWIGIIKYLPQF